MNQSGNHRAPDELRRLLQQGDPAGEGGLEPGHRHRIRRRIMAAAEAPDRRWLPALRPLGYALACLTAVAAGWLALQNLPRGTGLLPSQLPAEPAPLVAQELPGEVPPDAVAEGSATPVQVAAQPRAAPEPVALAVLPSTAPRQPRQMQFTAGTTRVIWTLDPDFELGPSNTAEQGETS